MCFYQNERKNKTKQNKTKAQLNHADNQQIKTFDINHPTLNISQMKNEIVSSLFQF